MDESRKSSRAIGLLLTVLTIAFSLTLLNAVMISSTFEKNDNLLSGNMDYISRARAVEREQADSLKVLREGLLSADPEEAELVDQLEESLLLLQERLAELEKDKVHEPQDNFGPSPRVIPPRSELNTPEIMKDKAVIEILEYEYNSADKKWPYTGNAKHMNKTKRLSRHWKNSLAVFPYDDEKRFHGRVGIKENGSAWWPVYDTPPQLKEKESKEAKEAMKRGGGFYLELSNSIGLDRDAVDGRCDMCREYAKGIDIYSLPDTSVIFTVFNEPLSTLLRSVTSVLNTTPPPLLREIILVDDHSDLPELGLKLDEALALFPKTKLLRLPHRHGLVQSRLAGISVAQGETVTVFDSHIECNPGWVEPLMKRIRESPKSLVFPQIPAIDSYSLGYENARGIGQTLSFKWVMQEQSNAVSKAKSPDAVPSASHAGGLFSVDREFFWLMGGYDENFTMWGAENVELPLRYWQCGARVECTPCSRVYHIYRNGGSGYKSPPNTIKINRLRTAMLWTDEYYELARQLIAADWKDTDIGPIDTMLQFKEQHKCKGFQWFKKELGIKKEPEDLDDITILGRVKHEGTGQCLDSLGNKDQAKPFGIFGCHEGGGTQAWVAFGDDKLRPATHERICVSSLLTFQTCETPNVYWKFEDGLIKKKDHDTCLGVDKDKKMVMVPCDKNDSKQKWTYDHFKRDPDFMLPTHSPEWLKMHHDDHNLRSGNS